MIDFFIIIFATCNWPWKFCEPGFDPVTLKEDQAAKPLLLNAKFIEKICFKMEPTPSRWVTSRLFCL